MRSESLILILCLFYVPVAVLDPVLKSLWNLDRMSICRLGYPASVYNNYGCWCGVGGSGKPMDGIDSTTSVTIKQLAKVIAMIRLRNTSFPIIGSAFKISPFCLNNANSKCGCAICACDSAIIKCWSRFEKPKIEIKCIKMDSDSVVRYRKPSFNPLSLLNKIFSSWK